MEVNIMEVNETRKVWLLIFF